MILKFFLSVKFILYLRHLVQGITFPISFADVLVVACKRIDQLYCQEQSQDFQDIPKYSFITSKYETHEYMNMRDSWKHINWTKILEKP